MSKKDYFVENLEPGLLFVDFFAVRKKDLIEYEDKTRLELELGDKTGRINAVVWHNAEGIYKLFEVEDIVKVKGKVTTYGDRLQIVIKRIRKATNEEYDPEDFLPQSEKDVSELTQTLKLYISAVKNSHLKSLLKSIFTEEFLTKFSQAPAGKLWHHRYLGGLIEHTLNVAKICEKSAEIYSELVDKDLLVAGALLHDIGKVEALKTDTFFDYNDKGRLVGHLVIGSEMIEEILKILPNFPTELAMKVKHMILSHHGNHDSGAPVLPQTPEAFILHFADQLDATMGAITRIKGETEDRDWSNYVKLLGRFLYFG